MTIHMKKPITFIRTLDTIKPNSEHELANAIAKYGIDNNRPYTVYQVHFAMLDIYRMYKKKTGRAIINSVDIYVGKIMPTFSTVKYVFYMDTLNQKIRKLGKYRTFAFTHRIQNLQFDDIGYIEFDDNVFKFIEPILKNAYSYAYETHTKQWRDATSTFNCTDMPIDELLMKIDASAELQALLYPID